MLLQKFPNDFFSQALERGCKTNKDIINGVKDAQRDQMRYY
jgi:hypothetical protein